MLPQPFATIRSPKFLRRFAKTVAILFLLACAGGPADLNEFTSYFLPESANAQNGDARYHFTQQFLYVDDYGDSLKIDQRTNAQAWAKYAGVSAEIVREYFYTETANASLPNRLMLKGNKAAVAYLTWAKKIEKAYQPAIYAWEESHKDSLVLVEALAQGQALAQNSTDVFLKERYGFQVVKLAMILDQPHTCLQLYDRFIKPLKTKTFISDWAASRRAGAILTLGDTAKALYEFAQIFDRCPSRRREADLSLRSKRIKFQEKALDYCQNDAEKAAVYALCAIQPLEDGLPMLQKIMEINPQNTLIELITAREINKNEYYLLGAIPYVEDTTAFEKRRDASSQYFEQIGDFALKNADNKATNNPAFWWTAASYVKYVLKDYAKANEYLAKAQAAPTENRALKQQITIQQLLLNIAQQDQVTPEFEQKTMALLEQLAPKDNFRVVNAYTRACGLLAKMYRGLPTDEAKPSGWWASCGSASSSKGDISNTHTAKAFLIEAAASWQSQVPNADGYAPIYATNTDRYALEDSTSTEIIAAIVAYLKQPNLTDFGKKLIALSGIDTDYLYVLLGRKYLAQHRYEEASVALGNVKKTVWQSPPFSDYLTQNPFYMKPANGQNPNDVFTPFTFAQRMASLQKQADKGDAEAAYLLGCGAYNMGYFGNSWLLTHRERSHVEYEYMYPPKDLSQDDYYVATQAKSYFDKALSLSKNTELSAKAAFGASLCTQNAYYVFRAAEGRELSYEESAQKAFWQRMNTEKRQRLGQYFDLLKSKYATTQYTREVIEECATYREYVGE